MKDTSKSVHPCGAIKATYGEFVVNKEPFKTRVREVTPARPASQGMTLREHYAGLAMQGLYASGEGSLAYHAMNIEQMADVAVKSADALLRALERTLL